MNNVYEVDEIVEVYSKAEVLEMLNRFLMRRGLIFKFYSDTRICPELIFEHSSLLTSCFVWSESTYDNWSSVSLEWRAIMKGKRVVAS